MFGFDDDSELEFAKSVFLAKDDFGARIIKQADLLRRNENAVI